MTGITKATSKLPTLDIGGLAVGWHWVGFERHVLSFQKQSFSFVGSRPTTLHIRKPRVLSPLCSLRTKGQS